MGLFLLHWSVDECLEKFQQFAGQAFQRRRLPTIPGLPMVHDLLISYFADCRYKTSSIEEAFEAAFGNVPMFNPLANDKKVVVTATTTKETHPCIFTNYNGSSSHPADCGYRLIRARTPMQEVTISDA